ncbi:MAG: PQQ-dependent sugar dehydrogenase [Cyclobacteriaceae bacterium]
MTYYFDLKLTNSSYTLLRIPLKTLKLFIYGTFFRLIVINAQAQQTSPEPIRGVKIGKNRELLVNGKPFLPIMSWAQPAKNYRQLRDLGFNTHTSGSADIVAAKEVGCYAVPGFREGKPENDFILGWIFDDEPDLPQGRGADAKPRQTAGMQDRGMNGRKTVTEVVYGGDQLTLLDSTFIISTIASHLDVPWEITWGPDNWIWYTEQRGTVSKVNPITGEKKLLLRIVPDVHRKNTLGLLCMALHPDMKNFPYVFLNYQYMKGSDLKSLQSKWVRYTYTGTTLKDPLVLFEIPADIGHNGSRIVFAPDGKLILATGDADHKNDAANSGNAQNLESWSGKILRMNIDGTIPEDNPFPGSPVWALGFRVPPGLVYASNGKLYSAEHGNVINDEVNLIEKGANYGYPNVSGVCDRPRELEYCASHTIKAPIIAWTPTIAPAGLDYYDNSAIPEWQNSLLLVTLKSQSLRVLKLNERGDSVLEDRVYFEKSFGRLRDICVSPDGEVYISTSNLDWNQAEGFPKENDDRIIKISGNKTSKIVSDAGGKTRNMKSSARAATVRSDAPGVIVYNNYCTSCHKPDGAGVPGTFPPLKGTHQVTGDKTKLIRLVLQGLSGPITLAGVKYDTEMPSFSFLFDQEVADVVGYVRSAFGQKQETVTLAEVKKIRGEAKN